MKAAVLNQASYQLEVAEMETPAPAKGEVLVKLKTASINHHELWSMRERSIVSLSPVIMGSDGAGEVAEVGAGVASAWIGKAVMINPSLNWGSNPRVQGPDYQILGFPRNGTFAKYISIPVEYVYEKPSHLDFDEASAIPLAGLTAYRALFTRGEPETGSNVLVTGVGGGAALFALQFAIAAGANAYVTSGSEEKIQMAVSLGAKAGVNYKESGWDKKLLALAGGFDIIIDSAAGTGFAALIELANPGARIVLFGRTAGKITQLNPSTIFWKQLSIHGSSIGNDEEFRAMIDFFGVHKLHPVVDSLFGLEDINKAFERMALGQQLGKMIITL
ncbi:MULTISPECIES: zinc-binding dehydrogenase [unclassified Imperialibacter]|uniref:zinc-binding dehydrogenase n=1 Tax=unclassified Imperialibacter TaxID=2629706 RepID=UPI00125C8BAD|nr:MULTISPECIES: zinc-binding dehydrogenase [unclassified Imperialibacter]CAD5264707.1 NADPH:quinone reductase [Imperialibacter sp. 89]CAD5269598.1 NADPH:quinone reductase [Imperialibacter sp. 75]VVT09216.1 NADPH:quinone reductase [Imperialibacter sp. EC-SDR9]